MNALATTTGKKLAAGGVLVVGAYVVFKVAIGLVTAVAWTLAAVVAVVAIIWALRTL